MFSLTQQPPNPQPDSILARISENWSCRFPSSVLVPADPMTSLCCLNRLKHGDVRYILILNRLSQSWSTNDLQLIATRKAARTRMQPIKTGGKIQSSERINYRARAHSYTDCRTDGTFTVKKAHNFWHVDPLVPRMWNQRRLCCIGRSKPKHQGPAYWFYSSPCWKKPT